MNLVVGSTGILGTAVCVKLALAGKPVCGLVRDASSDKAVRLADAGVTLLIGDLKDRESLRSATTDIETVICTASSTFSRRPGDSIETVDRIGVQTLIDEAEENGVRRFIFVSYASGDDDSPLSRAKQEAERRLQRSKMEWTIIQPALFCEVWLSPALGFDVAAGKARIFGEGDRDVGYVAVDDVADAIVACVDNPAASQQVYTFGGGHASQLDAVRAFERATGRKFVLDRMSVDVIKTERAKATDPMSKSFFSLMQHAAEGFPGGSDSLVELGVKPHTLDEWVRGKTGN